MGKPDRQQRLLNRELSWLEFNQRVLAEAGDPQVPLLERLFFLTVTASNLDEFFMVRIGGLHVQVDAGLTRPDPAGLSPAEQLRLVRLRVRRQLDDQYACLLTTLLPHLAQQGMELKPGAASTAATRAALHARFEQEIGPMLTPVAVDPERRLPLPPPLTLHLACRLAPAAAGEEDRFVVVRLGPDLPRLYRVPGEGRVHQFVLLEDLVRAFLPALLPGQEILEAAAFRVTRNADLPVDEEDAADLAAAMSEVLSERRTGPCVRLELESAASDELEAFLCRRLAVAAADVYRLPGPIDLTGLRELRAAVDDAALCYPSWPPQPNPALDANGSLFAQLAARDVLLATPYESFDPVVRLVEEAAADAQVRAIKIVLYRTSARGAIVRALMAAARAGKHVTALIELKARFDEARNIGWARDLEAAGVQVVYGVRNLKTHAKVCLVLRKEEGLVRHYTHFGTGNYNEVTARLYTDVGLLTGDAALGRDAAAFFHAVTGYSEPRVYEQLVQAPVNLRERLLELIAFETELARKGQPAQILARLNALADPALIAALGEASQAGVEIRLNVRGICCLRPGVRGLSANIRVNGVIDRFLEHSRIIHFLHGGDGLTFLSSADWMPRNLDRRIELMVPVRDPLCRKRLLEILRQGLDDNVKSWQLRSDGSYVRARRPYGQRKLRSQELLYEQAAAAARQARLAARTVYEPHLPPRPAAAAPKSAP